MKICRLIFEKREKFLSESVTLRLFLMNFHLIFFKRTSCAPIPSKVPWSRQRYHTKQLSISSIWQILFFLWCLEFLSYTLLQSVFLCWKKKRSFSSIVLKQIDWAKLSQCDLHAGKRKVEKCYRSAQCVVRPLSERRFDQLVATAKLWLERYETVCSSYTNLLSNFKIERLSPTISWIGGFVTISGN